MNGAGLRWDDDVLDVGCGIGRIARYLCGYLVHGSYEGFDVRADHVTWCQTNITPLFPNFRFKFVPVFNSFYSKDTSLPSAEELEFPYPDDSFDFVFALSLFTHLLPGAAQNYLNQTRRVLRPGGMSFMTWMIFEDDDTSTYDHPKVRNMQRHESGEYAMFRPDRPEAALAYREDVVRDFYSKSGLQIVEPIRAGFRTFQDAVIATK
jgi:SAM-dependent methyltransferase